LTDYTWLLLERWYLAQVRTDRASESFWLWLERQAYRFGHYCHARHPERRHR
jgi:hypothetical protein